MRYLFICLAVFLSRVLLIAQAPEWLINNWHSGSYEQELRFLASDEMQGRNVGEPGLDISARYIAEMFRVNGLLPLPGMRDYFQEVPFEKITPGLPEVRFLDTVLLQGENVLMLDGVAKEDQGVAVFISFEDTLVADEIRGKYVITLFGTEEIRSPMAAMQKGREKQKEFERLGAKGLFEIYTLQTPWSILSNYLNRERLQLKQDDEADSSPIAYGLIQLDNRQVADLRKNPVRPIQFKYSGLQRKRIPSYNVLAYKPGTLPVDEQEYVVLSAHYDHIGVRDKAPDEPVDQDTIFNGARDNGMGVVALLASADVLKAVPMKRSVVFAAWTGEEKGLLGSDYFIKNSPIELNKIRFNLNTDGAGYSDTTVISILGFDRVGAAKQMEQACQAFGLKVVVDPAKEQNLFDRSDNVRFAQQGIPAPTFSPGFRSFDEEIRKYYHRETDNPDSINYRYANAYWKAFAYAAYLIAQMESNPRWSAGDKYEEAARALYGSHY